MFEIVSEEKPHLVTEGIRLQIILPPAGAVDCAGAENGSPPRSPNKSMAVEPDDFEDCRLWFPGLCVCGGLLVAGCCMGGGVPLAALCCNKSSNFKASVYIFPMLLTDMKPCKIVIVSF